MVPLVAEPAMSESVSASLSTLLLSTAPLAILPLVTAVLAIFWEVTAPMPRSEVWTWPFLRSTDWMDSSMMSSEPIVLAAYAPPVPSATTRAMNEHTFATVSLRRSWRAIRASLGVGQSVLGRQPSHTGRRLLLFAQSRSGESRRLASQGLVLSGMPGTGELAP